MWTNCWKIAPVYKIQYIRSAHIIFIIMYTRIIYEISLDKRERRIGSFKRYKTSVLLSPYYFKDIKLSWRKKPQESGSDDDWVAVGWRTMNFSDYIDCVCIAEPTPADTFWSAAALDTRSQTTRLLRSSAMPTKERGSSEERGWWKDMRQHAARRARSRRVL